MRLPRVITSSVIRGADKGDSHGGVYLIDLETESSQQVLDWNTPQIDWEGRGGDRGLRGIAIHNERIYMAASDEIFVFDRDFKMLSSLKHPLLKHCHETFLHGSRLYITSTGYNAIMVLDLDQEKFVEAYRFSFSPLKSALYQKGFSLSPSWQNMDLSAPEKYTLVASDSLHINHVFLEAGKLFFSGTRVRHLFQFDFSKVTMYGQLPKGAHNARPFEGGSLLNDTAKNRLVLLDKKGSLREAYPVHHYAMDELKGENLPSRVARQGFARGLAQADQDVFIVGSSPATVNVFQRGKKKPLKTINLSMDLRNAIHGLEIWPFGMKHS